MRAREPATWLPLRINAYSCARITHDRATQAAWRSPAVSDLTYTSRRRGRGPTGTPNRGSRADIAAGYSNRLPDIWQDGTGVPGAHCCSNQEYGIEMTKIVFRLIVLVLPIAAGTACTASPIACPKSFDPAYELTGNAGCMVERERQMLVVRLRATGKLGVPGGAPQPGETAQCTAYRETREEAGLEVTVGELLHKFSETDFYLFDCVLAEPVNSAPDLDNLQTQATEEIAEVLWADPDEIERDEWRYPQGLARVQEVFRQRRQKNSIDTPPGGAIDSGNR